VVINNSIIDKALIDWPPATTFARSQVDLVGSALQAVQPWP